MAWLTAHAPRLFPMRHWRRVLFTDESRFTLSRRGSTSCVPTSRRTLCRRLCCRTGSVWGWLRYGLGRHCSRDKITVDYFAGNMTAVRYRDEILRPVAVPLVQQRNLILQQDNARPHVARVCQDFLANNNIAPLAWPPYSPDLTPIVHMWDKLARRVRKRRNPPATLAQLRNALIDEWNNIPM